MASEKSTLLELKSKMKKFRPHFVIKETNFSARVEKKWRFPRGKHSKVRQMHRGRPSLPNVGYGTPKEVKNLHHSGLEMVVVANKDDLLNLKSSEQGAIISSNVGAKKRVELLNLATENSIQVLNFKDAKSIVQKINDSFIARKKSKSEKLKEKDKKLEEKRKRSEEKKKKEQQEKETKEKESTAKTNVVDKETEDKVKKEQQKAVEKEIIKRQ